MYTIYTFKRISTSFSDVVYKRPLPATPDSLPEYLDLENTSAYSYADTNEVFTLKDDKHNTDTSKYGVACKPENRYNPGERVTSSLKKAVNTYDKFPSGSEHVFFPLSVTENNLTTNCNRLVYRQTYICMRGFYILCMLIVLLISDRLENLGVYVLLYNRNRYARSKKVTSLLK